MRLLQLLVAILPLITACAHHVAIYDVELAKVERSAPELRQSERVIVLEHDTINRFVWEDDVLHIVWLPLTDRFAFTLRNKTDRSMRLVWDDAAFVDEFGGSQRVMHQGVKYADRNERQAPSVVVRGPTLTDVIIPTPNVSLDLAAGGWQTDPLFVRRGPKDELARYVTSLIGKTVQILLPVQLEDRLREYIFTFTVRHGCWGPDPGAAKPKREDMTCRGVARPTELLEY